MHRSRPPRRPGAPRVPLRRSGKVRADGPDGVAASGLSRRPVGHLRGHPMIGMAIAWWIASGVLGLAALPAAQRLFSRLPDRGYGLSRSLGILGAGYLFWMGGSLGLLRNDLGGALLGVLGLLGASMAIGRRGAEARAWVSEHWRAAVVMGRGVGLLFPAHRHPVKDCLHPR